MVYHGYIISSSDHFEPVRDLLSKETGKIVDIAPLVNACKINLYKNIEHSFLSNWTELEFDESLILLEASKAATQNEEKKWRPTNVPVREQICPHVVKTHQKNKKMLNAIIKNQNKDIETLVLEIEELRSRFKKRVDKLELLLAEIAADREKFKDAEQHIKKIQEKLH